MIRDILTVARKEIREIIGGGSSSRRGLLRELVFVFLFGVFFPVMDAEAWATSIAPAIFFLAIPLFVGGPHVADSFAGEKERRTLETLLATRLPDRAIYLGKIAAVCAYTWGLCWVVLLASLVTLNVVHPDAAGAGPILYPRVVWLSVGLGSIVSALLIAGIGTFISLRSETVRGAHQALMMPLLLLLFGLSFGIPALVKALPPETRAWLAERLEGVSATAGLGWALAILLAIDLVLLRIGVRLFRRGRLIAGK